MNRRRNDAGWSRYDAPEAGFGVARDFGPEPTERRRGPLVLAVGIGVFLVFAAVVWQAYSQGVRSSGQGGPPLIRADEGPFRVASSSTTAVRNDQGELEVYDTFNAGDGETDAEAPADAAPDGADSGAARANMALSGGLADGQSPADDSQGDGSGQEQGGQPDIVIGEDASNEFAAEPTPIATPDATEATPVTLDDGAALQPDVAETQAPAAPQATPTPEPTPTPTPQTQATPTERTPSDAEADPLQARLDAFRAANRPISPPTEPSPTATEAAGGMSGIMPSTTDDGEYAVQIASFRTRPSAEEAWARLRNRFPELLSAREPEIIYADLGGRGVRYRVRMPGFDDRARAVSFCNRLIDRGQECLVVRR